MSRPRRFLKKTSIIESSSDSEEEISNKKINLPFDKSNSSGNQNIKQSGNHSSSSDSDIENYLQPIDKLDFSSSFFNLKKNEDDVKNVHGVKVSRLSDSESNSDHTENTACSSKKNEIEQTKEAHLNFQKLEKFALKIEEAKIQVEKYNLKTKINEKKINISNILAAGETKQLSLDNIKVEDLHPSDFETTDDEEWEEVKLKDPEEKPVVPRKDIEICINEMPGNCRKKKGNNLLTAMKRRLNRIRKENQIYVHKVHLLCWIAHGNFLNSIISESEILCLALALLPSDKCYPIDRIDLSYFEQIVQWYKRTIRLSEKPPSHQFTLLNALKYQIKKKEAYDKNAYVLIFIAILRALGVQCRMVLSFQVESLKPPSNELHSLSTKESNKSGELRKQNLSKNSSTSTQKSVKERENMLVKSNEIKNHKDNENTKKNECKIINIREPSTSSIKKENSLQNGVKKINNNRENTNKKYLKTRLKKNNETTDTSHRNSLSLNDCTSNKSVVSSKFPTSVKLRNINGKREKKEVSQLNKTINRDKRETGKAFSKEVNTDEKNDLLLKDNKPRSKTTDKKKSSSSIMKRKLTSTKSKNSDENKILQLDGSNDDSPKKILKKKCSLQKRKNNMPVKKKMQKHPKVLKSSFDVDDSESEFSSSSLNKSAEQKLPSTSRSSRIQSSFRNDIIGIIKGRMSEQKHIDRSRLVQKRKPSIDFYDSDSDYMPEPIKKKAHNSDSDIEYFVPKPKVKKRVSIKKLSSGQPILSDSDESLGKKKKSGNNIWLELFLESEEKWITADVIRGQVHCVNELYMRATHPITYIVAWNNDHTIKDVTRRYCKNFSTVTRKLRVDVNWWEDTVKPFMEKNTARSKEEDHDLNRQQLDQPLPTTISEFKNHPLYALRRHLLKFEEIYPPEQVPLGFVKGEPVYPRNCVYVCKSRDIWLKEAKVVKSGEKPYKIVKARPKYDKLSNTVISDQLLEIFGPWQITDYDPPTAENGIVPRNAFGNVELFKPCMLPKKTVHLTLPGLNKVCKKLNIDCASAIVGFDFHGGWSHPVYDGFVVCEEYADICIAAWDAEQQQIEKKENEKIEKRVYTNWRRLIKGLLIRERLKARYDFGEETSTGIKENKKVGISRSRKVAAKKT